MDLTTLNHVDDLSWAPDGQAIAVCGFKMAKVIKFLDRGATRSMNTKNNSTKKLCYE